MPSRTRASRPPRRRRRRGASAGARSPARGEPLWRETGYKPRVVNITYPDLKGKHVLITGGANGIGAGVALGFAAQGARVTVLDSDARAGAKMADKARAPGTELAFHTVDLCDFERLVGLLKSVETERGAVDVLVNNAAWDPRYRLTD